MIFLYVVRLTVLSACTVLFSLCGCTGPAITGCSAVKLVADGNLKAFETWVARVAPDVPDCNGAPLIVLILEEDVPHGDVAVGILLRFGVDANVSDPRSKRTALHAASGWGAFETVKTLLEHGADSNAKDSRGTTPLMNIAGTRGTPRARDIVDLLVKSGASLEARDPYGKTAADYAKSAGNPDLQNYIEQLQSIQNK